MTTTPAKGLSQPNIGGDNNTWGALLNAGIALIDNALGGTATKSISGNITLSTTEAQNTGYKFTGTLSGNATITWPTFAGMAAIRNATTGGFSIICGIAGTTVTVLNGEVVAIWSDGTDFVRLAQIGGGIGSTGSGQVVLGTSPTIASPSLTGTISIGTITLGDNGDHSLTLGSGQYLNLQSNGGIVFNNDAGPILASDADDTLTITGKGTPTGNSVLVIQPAIAGDQAVLSLNAQSGLGQEERLMITGQHGSSYQIAQFVSGTGQFYGLDITNGGAGGVAFSMVSSTDGTSSYFRVPNNKALYARNASNSSDLDIVRLDSSNVLQLGTGAVQIKAPVTMIAPGFAISNGSNFAALSQDGSFAYIFPNTAGTTNPTLVVGGGSTMNLIVTGTLTVNAGPLTLAGQTSSPGSSTGTLTNAPSVGNPNVWLQVSINGTTRHIPAW